MNIYSIYFGDDINDKRYFEAMGQREALIKACDVAKEYDDQIHTRMLNYKRITIEELGEKR